MTNDEAKKSIYSMMMEYQKQKEENNFDSSFDFILKNIITTYYDFVIKPEFSFVINEYKKQYVFNEARVEENITEEEVAGLGAIYDYIQDFNFDKDYFNIFTTSLLLHQKLYSKCPHPDFGGSLRELDACLNGLPVEIPTAKVAKKRFNQYIKTSNEVFLPLEDDDIFSYINKVVKLTADLIFLQPFSDGNKRTFRALQNLLFKRINLPPVYIEVSERDKYKENLILAMTEHDYDSLIRFYYYKICDAIMNLDINRSMIAEESQHKVKSLALSKKSV